MRLQVGREPLLIEPHSFREVEDALVAIRKTREQMLAQEQQVASLRWALDLAVLRYQEGVANYLDLLVAQRNFFDAELSLTATRRLHLVSIVQLYRALGGGWSPEPASKHSDS